MSTWKHLHLLLDGETEPLPDADARQSPLSVAEAAAALGVARKTIYRALDAEKLPGAFKIGSRWKTLLKLWTR